jgi:hypothetical protein
VVDEFYKLFLFILDQEPSIKETLKFMKDNEYKYISFANPVLDSLEVKTK